VPTKKNPLPAYADRGFEFPSIVPYGVPVTTTTRMTTGTTTDLCMLANIADVDD